MWGCVVFAGGLCGVFQISVRGECFYPHIQQRNSIRLWRVRTKKKVSICGFLKESSVDETLRDGRGSERRAKFFSLNICLYLCRTSMVRHCCCWLCPQSRSVWTWSSVLPSNCVTRSSVSRWPFTDSTLTDRGAAPASLPLNTQTVQRNVVVLHDWEMLD